MITIIIIIIIIIIMSFVCVLSCVLSGGGPDIVLTIDFREVNPCVHLSTVPSKACGPTLWSRSNIVTSHSAGPGSISSRVNFLVEVFSGVFPQP